MNSAAVINLHNVASSPVAFSSSMRMETSTVAKVKTRCSTCNLREICLPCGLQANSSTFDDLVYTRKRVKRGETLYRSGEAFDALYAVRTGFFKAFVVLSNHSEPQYRRACAKAGARYFLDKSTEFDCVRTVIAEIAAQHH